jgi:putative DNA primase/helicase
VNKRNKNNAPRRDIDPASEKLGPILIRMSEIVPQEVRWLWPGRMARGHITLLVGNRGAGKSFLTLQMAAHVTRGKPWPDGTKCARGHVLLISDEDQPKSTIHQRLTAAGADLRKVHFFKMVRQTTREGDLQEVMFTLDDVKTLEKALVDMPRCRLIIVDPIGSFMGGRADAHRDNEVRAVLSPVATLAEKYGAAVVVVAHRRKSSSRCADDLALGSVAFTAIARAVWHLCRDPNEKDRRLLLPGKNNLAPEGTGLAFNISGDPPSISWESDPVKMSADEALALEERLGPRGPQQKQRRDAATWLKGLLTNRTLRATQVFRWARNAGFSKGTIQRAKISLGIKPRRDRFKNGRWIWKLPKKRKHNEHDP